MKSILLIENGKIFEKSEAALRIAGKLRFPWNLATAFGILPLRWRDKIYDYIAENRYKWFGKQETCVYSMHKYENRFI